ncbi:MAG: DUF488 family protein [Firmicutes bacterium]|jgi:uncharacterized protein YeaO (DUF488 family)|nr:DUF488 family protein [Bacillota bacterium]HBQ96473.1 hypothetical protein [Sulfobacillus sp.]
MRAILIARIKEGTPSEFYRILVDRLWPRGIRKDQTFWQEWLPEVAPSTQLRRYFHGHWDDLDTFRIRYLHELRNNTSSQLQRLFTLVQTRPVALLTFSRDIERSQVPILREFLKREAHDE